MARAPFLCGQLARKSCFGNYQFRQDAGIRHTQLRAISDPPLLPVSSAPRCPSFFFVRRSFITAYKHNKHGDYWIMEESHQQKRGQRSSHHRKYRLYIMYGVTRQEEISKSTLYLASSIMQPQAFSRSSKVCAQMHLLLSSSSNAEDRGTCCRLPIAKLVS